MTSHIHRQKASLTALMIAIAMVYLKQQNRYDHLLAKKIIELSSDFLEIYRGFPGWLNRYLRCSWLSKIFTTAENASIPGTALHFLLRKIFIEEKTREILRQDFQQVVILGAGLDTLTMRLAEDFCDVNFFEIDQASTQWIKLMSPKAAQKNLHFLPLDLEKKDLRKTLLEHPFFDPHKLTLFVAEGLLMYLNEKAVDIIFQVFHECSAKPSRIIFSFLEIDRNNRFVLEELNILAKISFRLSNIHFAWGLKPETLDDFLKRQKFQKLEVVDAMQLRKNYLPIEKFLDHRVLQGEQLVYASKL